MNDERTDWWMERAIPTVRRSWAVLVASPRKVTVPSFAKTSIPVAFTFRWNKSADFTLVSAATHPYTQQGWWHIIVMKLSIAFVLTTDRRFTIIETYPSEDQEF